MKVVMPGGTGHVGHAIRRYFEPRGWAFVILTRNPARPEEVRWDGITLGDWAETIDGADLVINLAGRSVNCRYSESNLKVMLDSRVDSTRVLGQAISQAKKPPALWLQASTATIYAHRFDSANDELTGELNGDGPGSPHKWAVSFEIATAWEHELDKASTPSTRKVALRSAMTMSEDQGSVFDVLASLARRGIGGPAGDGKQFVSWIHENDFVRALEFLVQRTDLDGAINLCSPNPLSNREFMSILRKELGVRWYLPTPAWLLEIGAVMMKTETELILKSRRVVPTRLLQAGFEFRFPTWAEAAKDLATNLKRR